MALKATFNGMSFENIEGYRIACRLTPGEGFGTNFHVYIDERRQANKAFTQDVKVSEKGDNIIQPVKGTLQISDVDRSYEFKNIELKRAHMGATRRERTRYFEFSYDPDDTDRGGASPITIDGRKSTPLEPGGLGADYMAGLGPSRHLLGFKAYVAAGSSTIVRFSNLGCLPDSFLAKVVELCRGIASSEEQLAAFQVKFSQGDLAVNHENVAAIYVDESYGSLLLEPSVSFEDIIQQTSARPLSIERLRAPEPLANELLEHNIVRQFRGQEAVPGTVETATILFKGGGIYADLSVK